MPDPSDAILEFKCPKCDKRLKAGSHVAGRRVKCPSCNQPVMVPGAQPKAAVSDDQWLTLDEPAISDLPERQKHVEEVRAARPTEGKVLASKRAEQSLGESRGATVTPPAKSAMSPSGDRLAAVDRSASGDSDEYSLQPEMANSPPSQPSPPAAGAKSPAGAPPPASIFDEDLPELAAIDPHPVRHSRAERSSAKSGPSTEPEGDLFGLGSELDALLPKALPPAAAPPRHAENGLEPLYAEEAAVADPEYRIKCGHCDTAQYVRLSSKGKKIKCPDCFAVFRIPGPPPGWKPRKAHLETPQWGGGTEMGLAPAAVVPAGTAPTHQQQAANILRKAEAEMHELSDDEVDSLYRGDFDNANFVQRTFGFLKDPVAVGQIVGYGIIFAMLFGVAQFALNSEDLFMQRGMLLLVSVGGGAIGVLFALPMLSGGLALIESVANGQRRVSEWPGFNLFDNIGDVLAIAGALAASLVPGFFVGYLLGGNGEGGGRIMITGMMVTCFVLFPVVLMSMLDNGSLFQPISQSVLRSFRAAADAWGGYFLKCLFAYFFVMLLWLLLLGEGKSPILAAIAGFLLPLLVFYTCQQIGALAESISDQLSFEFAPSDESETEDS
ncbi:RING finger protein [Aureliella helgolandensis]|uniref:Uncharacterized protein n=1 Tax=Aureliella helgolandensis TaxID=2527968 RepID=A0A518G4Z9_9BACT|nr:hypothetical protein [Aureliella helgolandensis]QDV23678.1 hypothetical protein Q31a_19830 [Aureliella helgolandensis]